MSRKFIAAIVALSLTVTGVTASQAQAGDKRTRNLIVGAAALAIIGAAIANQDRDERIHVGRANTRHLDRNRHGVKPHHHKRHVKQRHHKQHVKPRYQKRSHNGLQPRPLPRRAQANHLPNRCLRSYPARGGGYIQAYDARCVQNHRNRASNHSNNRR